MTELQAIMPDTDTAPDGATTLSDHWLRDQSIAFAATLLGDIDEDHLAFFPLPCACGTLVAESIDIIRAGLVSDSTLALISSVNPGFLCEACFEADARPELAAVAEPLARAVSAAKDELAKREAISADGLNRVLISHAVYVLKRPHVSALKFLKWIHRAAPEAVPGVKHVLASLKRTDSDLGATCDAALAESRNPNEQTRDRLDQIDRLYALILQAAGRRRNDVELWWTRICMAYRSSLFCWPLLAEGRFDGWNGYKASGRGLSLPISLFLLEDGQSTWQREPNPNGQKVWFKYKLSRAEETAWKEPRFREIRDGLPAHINGFRFGFTGEWWNAFRVGVDVAKKLWSSQNGRLRFADAHAAERKLTASLNVDIRAACDIVEAVYARVDAEDWSALQEPMRFFVVAERSAEAYWVQCVLGLLLPSRDVPLGLCTGTIDYRQGEFEMGDVDGIVAKLEYANRAGVPRVVVPGDSREFHDADSVEDEDATENGGNEGAGADRSDGSVPSWPDANSAHVRAFLQRVNSGKSRKTLEVNLARTARAAADAMQSSGWRRTSFLRTHDFQRSFGRNQRRLFIRDSLRDPRLKRHLKRTEIAWYEKARKWFSIETAQLEQLDCFLLSDVNRSVKYVKRSQIRGKVPNSSIEATLGKWVAWKDNQIRTGAGIGYRGPGLGVLTLRTAEGDHELRLWAALAEMLDANDDWWDRFQWSNLPQSADLLAQLLCNQRADPQISLASAPDLLILFDDNGMTQKRTNVIFPKEFRHQFCDLLNPRDFERPDYLDEALKRRGQDALGHPTRIIVVIGDDEPIEIDEEGEPLEPEQRQILEQLAIFRFGCSRQAGFAMANFTLDDPARISWRRFEQTVNRFIKSGLLSASRSNLQLTRKARERLGFLQYNALAHRQAALALCPILHPKGQRISSNRDRQLEPENVLEAAWHLRQAFSLVPWRFRSSWHTRDGNPPVPDSQALLTYLRNSPDWDTVMALRVNSKTRVESVELCRELLQSQRFETGQEPPSTIVAQSIETLGRLFKNEAQKKETVDSHAMKIVSLVDDTMTNLKEENLTRIEWQRRLRHLFSRQIFALRMLGLPLTDPLLAGSKAYIDKAVSEILESDFLDRMGAGREGLDDFPISHDCWRTLWTDGKDEKAPNKTLTMVERSSYAYAAARANLRKTRAGHPPTEPWDEPWMAYFTLACPENISPSKITGPLKTWWDIYGLTPKASREFGRRVLDMQTHAQQSQKGRRDWSERWSRDIEGASRNLWLYVTHPDPKYRLTKTPVAPALRLINVLSLQESLPAFRFVVGCGRDWLGHWPSLALAKPDHWPDPASASWGFVAEEWAALGNAVVGHMAGWVAMLGDLASLPDDEARLYRVWIWLKAYHEAGAPRLANEDPEDLLNNAKGLPSVMAYKLSLRRAWEAAEHILSLYDDHGWALDGYHRSLFENIITTLQR